MICSSCSLLHEVRVVQTRSSSIMQYVYTEIERFKGFYRSIYARLQWWGLGASQVTSTRLGAPRVTFTSLICLSQLHETKEKSVDVVHKKAHKGITEGRASLTVVIDRNAARNEGEVGGRSAQKGTQRRERGWQTRRSHVESDQQLDCGLDLMRRLPPQQVEKNLNDLIDLCPRLLDDLLSAVDQPLKIARDKDTGKEYLLCDYNRDGDSYRSPWSNTYDPPLEDGAMPSDKLRKLEIEVNAAFEAYRDAYFEGGVSSVYFWDLDYGFAGVVLIKKIGDGCRLIQGCWDSIHVIEIQEKAGGRHAHYKLTSTVMLWLQTNRQGSGMMNLGGSMTRQVEADHPVNDSTNTHLVNMGRMIEDMESKIRSTLNEIYFGKTKQIVGELRTMLDAEELKRQKMIANEIKGGITK
uniref:F-actin-capping protein subunit beta n=1 Tax=Ascaris lumbricoides TaxID=6252 RepID=A0A9J2Q465_ASCLU